MKKIPTIFKRDLKNMSNILREPHPDCLWVFEGEGVATRKYDGTCCKMENGKYYKRRQVKPGQKTPVDFVEEMTDNNTGKKFGWVPVVFGAKEDIYHVEAYDIFVEAFNTPPSDGTYELVGPKIKANPENCNKHILIKHSNARIYDNVERSYEGLLTFLKDKDIEGLVFHHPDGRMAKIKKRDFGLKRVTYSPSSSPCSSSMLEHISFLF